jgi:hypothetical protein
MSETAPMAGNSKATRSVRIAEHVERVLTGHIDDGSDAESAELEVQRNAKTEGDLWSRILCYSLQNELTQESATT